MCPHPQDSSVLSSVSAGTSRGHRTTGQPHRKLLSSMTSVKGTRSSGHRKFLEKVSIQRHGYFEDSTDAESCPFLLLLAWKIDQAKTVEETRGKLPCTDLSLVILP